MLKLLLKDLSIIHFKPLPFFYKQQGSKDIKPRVVYSDTYKKLREEGNGIEINLY